MAESQFSLSLAGDFSKPVNTLIERVSDAFGGIFRPFQIRRVAQAEADATIIRAQAESKKGEIEYRAMTRLLAEETQRQKNIESILLKALPHVEETAKPENIDPDWMTNFFDASRSVSNENMQDLWAKILAGEANTPGAFSARTIIALKSISIKEATLFSIIVSFGVRILGDLHPLIFNTDDQIYTDNALDFAGIAAVESTGLIRVADGLAKHALRFNVDEFDMRYGSTFFRVGLSKDANRMLTTGSVVLTNSGHEMEKICSFSKKRGFEEYLMTQLRDHRHTVAIVSPEERKRNPIEPDLPDAVLSRNFK